METREQKALLRWFMSQTHNVNQGDSYKALLAKANVCPKCWLRPKAGRNREQTTELSTDRGALVCRACGERYSLLDR